MGAILYECLTGRPPFRGATVLDTIQQVVASDSPSMRQLQPSCPRDLETICHKCLHKDARQRYGTAGALAEDLRRFQAGEPILARLVGRVERLLKWVRRNPVLTGALAAVALALLLGTGVSMYFAVAAEREAEQARGNEADAVAARKDLAKTACDLETTLARNLLRPLAAQGGDQSISEPEWDALWELAMSRPGPPGQPLPAPLRRPVGVRPFCTRAEARHRLHQPSGTARNADHRCQTVSPLDTPMHNP